jgi:hydrogenase 3 maturation protease
MPSLTTILKRKLDGAARIAVLAVGSSLRGDDAAGLLVAAHLAKAPPASAAAPQLRVFVGETAPENLTGEIRQFQPTHLLIVDAADFGGTPGQVELIDPAALTQSMSASTHGLPLSVVASYLRESLGCQVFILGLQPASREFGRPVSAEVLRAAEELAALILAALGV